MKAMHSWEGKEKGKFGKDMKGGKEGRGNHCGIGYGEQNSWKPARFGR